MRDRQWRRGALARRCYIKVSRKRTVWPAPRLLQGFVTIIPICKLFLGPSHLQQRRRNTVYSRFWSCELARLFRASIGKADALLLFQCPFIALISRRPQSQKTRISRAKKPKAYLLPRLSAILPTVLRGALHQLTASSRN